MSAAADYRSDTLQSIDFDIPCELKWGVMEQQTDCGPAQAVADADFISGYGDVRTKFACGVCVARMDAGGWLLGVRYF